MNSIKKDISSLTVDLEEWFHGAYPGFSPNGKFEAIPTQLDKVVLNMLKLLAEYNSKSTFFVLGELAQKYPELIKEIHNQGHAISSHGLYHIQTNLLGLKGFRENVEKSIEIIGNVINVKLKGFRAPNFSLNPHKTPWAFEILKELGFEYDSSIFPALMYYGGATRFSRFITDINGLEEYPPSCFNVFGTRISFAGGFYLRVLPKWLISKGIKKYCEMGYTPVLYIHPKDIDNGTPSLPVDPISNFVHRGLCGKGFAKLEWILKFSKVISIEEYREYRKKT